MSIAPLPGKAARTLLTGANQHFLVIVPLSHSLADALHPQYLHRHFERLEIGDHIELRDEALTWYAEAIVIGVDKRSKSVDSTVVHGPIGLRETSSFETSGHNLSPEFIRESLLDLDRDLAASRIPKDRYEVLRTYFDGLRARSQQTSSAKKTGVAA